MRQLDELIREYKDLGIGAQINYDKFYLYSIITHSTAIEGSTVTEIENQILFDEGIGAEKPITEQLMNLDLKAAYEEAFKCAHDHEEVTPKLLCRLSGKVMKNTGARYNTMTGSFDSSLGDLRKVNVIAGRGGHSYVAWQKVEGAVEEFCDWLNECRSRIEDLSDEQIYALSFEAHYRLVYIHPWVDGNGRMARLVMNMIQAEAGTILSIVKKDRRAEYIRSLEGAERVDDPRAFIDFMFDHHSENLEKQIAEYKSSLSRTGVLREKSYFENYQRRTNSVVVDLSDEETKLLREYAALHGMSVSELARRAVMDRIEQGI